ncbi:RNA ligase family protein [Nocardia sp. NBC_00416]|uniref:RNA ligase family protein n=1 Tax=Nocardia sp. NBC_00416 TaxID=2975991 RepID=UPI002E1EA76C
MVFDVRNADLDGLNSATKYPSIPTYHALGERGSLTGAVTEFAGRVIGTEKVDGTNARVIGLPDGTWLLGSREELLCAKGDLIGNPALGIVAALREFAEAAVPDEDVVQVFYVELYGGKITGASAQYTGRRAVGYRMFDLVVLRDYTELFAASRAEISRWRESGGQPFASETDLAAAAHRYGLELTPRLFDLPASELPTEIDKTRDFLAEFLPRTRCDLDADAGGRPEGIVLRTADRSVIAKARYEDYDRTLRRRGSGR